MRKAAGYVAMIGLSLLSATWAGEASQTAWVADNLKLMVWVPGGTYIMGPSNPNWQSGNTYPPHKVILTGFYISKYNTSYGLYDDYTRLAKLRLLQSQYVGGFFRSAKHPVDMSTWYQANNYCQWLAKKTGLPFDLPTEAQWEYVARDLGKPNWPFATNNGQQELGKNFPSYDQLSDQKGNIGGGAFSLPVGSLPCTPMGICGMNAEVNEWVKDWYSADYYAHSPVNNPQGPLTGTEKTLRGGGPTDDGTVSNNYGRDGNQPDAKNGGFRCVINSTLPMAQLKAQALQRS